MVQGFSDEARASLSACYTPAELTSLERLLATPTAGLHIRCNELQSSREELLDELRRQPQLQGFRVEPHPILRDVAFVPRKPRAAALAPYLALDADPRLRGPQRFIERKRRGLPPHEIFLDRVCAEAVLKGADAFVRGLRGASYGVDAGDVSAHHGAVELKKLTGWTMQLEGLDPEQSFEVVSRCYQHFFNLSFKILSDLSKIAKCLASNIAFFSIFRIISTRPCATIIFQRSPYHGYMSLSHNFLQHFHYHPYMSMYHHHFSAQFSFRNL